MNSNKANSLSLIFGGLLPIIAFTLIEENYGPVWGTLAGMIFGLGEIIFEIIKYKKVSLVTWIGNGMILALGGISIVSQEGIWFKLQPALFEGFFALFLWGSLIAKKNFLLLMAEKQGTVFPDAVRPHMQGLCFRLGLFFAVHAALATYAAFYWTTAQWAMLKGVGVFATMIVYMAFEFLWLRLSLGKANHKK